MAETRVVNMFAERYDVYIGRAGKGLDGYFGNPHRLPKKASPDDRARVLGQFATYFLGRIQGDADFRKRVLALRGKALGCFCAPAPCHGDIIVEWLKAHPACSRCGEDVAFRGGLCADCAREVDLMKEDDR
jgi:hypothetical protein